MTTEYRLLDPNVGLYTTYNTLKEVQTASAKMAFEFFMAHTHQTPYVVVTINDDGSETWRAPDGDERVNPDEIAALIEEGIRISAEGQQ